MCDHIMGAGGVRQHRNEGQSYKRLAYLQFKIDFRITTDCSSISTHKFLGSLLINLNAGQPTTGLSAFPHGYASNLLTRAGEYIGLIHVHRISTYSRPSFFGTGRSTLLTESSGIGKKRKIINEAQAHAKSTCHIPKENHPSANFILAPLHCAQCICRLFFPTHHPAPTCALRSPATLGFAPPGWWCSDDGLTEVLQKYLASLLTA
jgi:hypothetical protein